MDAKNSGEDQAGTQSGHQTISVDCNSPSNTPRAPAVMAKWIDVYKQQNEKSPGWLGYSPKTPIPKNQQEGRRSKMQKDGRLSNIFDGTNVATSDSPWAKFLVDEGEDSDYLQNCEHDDNTINMYKSMQRLSANISTLKLE